MKAVLFILSVALTVTTLKVIHQGNTGCSNQTSATTWEGNKLGYVDLDIAHESGYDHASSPNLGYVDTAGDNIGYVDVAGDNLGYIDTLPESK